MTDKPQTRIDLMGNEVPLEAATPVAPAKLDLKRSYGADPSTAPAVPAATLTFNIASDLGRIGLGQPSLILPVGAHHFDVNGKHVKGLNETRNYGIGISAPIISDNKDLAAMEVFATAYRSSYADLKKYKGDVAVVVGVNYDPHKVDMGPLQLKAGLMAGVAYTTKGSYAMASPSTSMGKFTVLGGVHAEVTHKESGVSLGANVIFPETRAQAGVAAFYLKKTF